MINVLTDYDTKAPGLSITESSELAEEKIMQEEEVFIDKIKENGDTANHADTPMIETEPEFPADVGIESKAGELDHL